MMKSILTLILGVLILPSCIMIGGEKGNGKIETKEFDITDYTFIELAGSAELIYEQKVDEEPYLKIEVDENLIPYIIAEVVDGKLRLRTTKSINTTKYIIHTNSTAFSGAVLSGSGKMLLQDSIYAENVKLSISGSGNMSVDNLDCDNIELTISGSGSVSVDDLDCYEVRASLSGSGRTILAGTAYKGRFDVSGSGGVQAADLQTVKTTSSVSGSGNIFVNVTDSLSAKVSGSGSVTYKGDPQYTNNVTSGSGKIKQEK